MSEQNGGGPALFPLRRRTDHLVLVSEQASVDFFEGQAKILRDLGVDDDHPYLQSIDRYLAAMRERLAERVGRVEIQSPNGRTAPVGPRAEPKHKPRPKGQSAPSRARQRRKPRLSVIPGGAA
jgi:hypothetical protein